MSERTKRTAGAAGRTIGRFIVADPSICHGQATFVGTRILVADVLEQVAQGMAWETIVQEWRGDISTEAVSEAVRLAREAFGDATREARGSKAERIHA